jgi:hypothetical protein
VSIHPDSFVAGNLSVLFVLERQVQDTTDGAAELVAGERLSEAIISAAGEDVLDVAIV